MSQRYNECISVRTLANWRCSGGGPPFSRIGGRILYELTQLEAWEQKRTVDHTSQYRK